MPTKPAYGTPLIAGHELAEDLELYWLLNEGEGTVAHDATGHGYDANIQGSAAWVSGIYSGPALNCPNVGDNVLLNDVPINFLPFTMIVCGKHVAETRDVLISVSKPGTNDKAVRTNFEPTNKVRAQFMNVVNEDFYTAATWPTSDPIMIFFVCEAPNNKRIYVNGVYQRSGYLTLDYAADISTTSLAFVNNPDYSSGRGRYEFGAIYSKVLSDAQITAFAADPFQMFGWPVVASSSLGRRNRRRKKRRGDFNFLGLR